jgi:hypothetical protein
VGAGHRSALQPGTPQSPKNGPRDLSQVQPLLESAWQARARGDTHRQRPLEGDTEQLGQPAAPSRRRGAQGSRLQLYGPQRAASGPPGVRRTAPRRTPCSTSPWARRRPPRRRPCSRGSRRRRAP